MLAGMTHEIFSAQSLLLAFGTGSPTVACNSRNKPLMGKADWLQSADWEDSRHLAGKAPCSAGSPKEPGHSR